MFRVFRGHNILSAGLGSGLPKSVEPSSLERVKNAALTCLLVLVFLPAIWASDAPAPRAARSVHLGYLAPKGEWFYTALVVEQSVNGSYFMACGWNTGYFGIQQLGRANAKVVLFSVWDPTRGNNPNAVKRKDRVEVLYHGQGVRIRRFGGEGTGGQCMAPFPWQIGQTNRFLVHAVVEGKRTAYTAWIERPDRHDWWKLATFRTRTGGQPLRGYYSFIEDFRRDGRSAHETRRARFGEGWVKTTEGQWVPLEKARFTASNATWESKPNIDAGLAGHWFYLATGGAIHRSRPLRSIIDRPVAATQPPPWLVQRTTHAAKPVKP